MVYEIKEFNQNAEVDETYSSKNFPIFWNERKVTKYVKKHQIYGKILAYDEEEWNEYNNYGEDLDCDVEPPEIVEEWDTNNYLKR